MGFARCFSDPRIFTVFNMLTVLATVTVKLIKVNRRFGAIRYNTKRVHQPHPETNGRKASSMQKNKTRDWEAEENLLEN